MKKQTPFEAWFDLILTKIRVFENAMKLPWSNLSETENSIRFAYHVVLKSYIDLYEEHNFGRNLGILSNIIIQNGGDISKCNIPIFNEKTRGFEPANFKTINDVEKYLSSRKVSRELAFNRKEYNENVSIEEDYQAMDMRGE